jgi:uncharacterized membrane protein YqjE
VSSAPLPGSSEQQKDPPSNIATAIAEVSEHASILVREEIELAKAEITEKGAKLARGAVVGVVAGVFFAMALVFVLVGFAWLLYYILPGNDFTYFWGFFAMALILVVLGVIAGLIAARVVKRSSPPVPDMAIDEARKIREDLTQSHDGGIHASSAVATSFPPPPPPPPPSSAPSTAPPAAASAPPAEQAPPSPPPAENTGGEG